MFKTSAAVILFWFCLLLATGSCHSQTVNIQTNSEQDHYRHLITEKSYTESWNYLFMLDTGETLSFSFLLSNLGLTSGAASAQISLSSPHSDPVTARDEHGQSDFTENRGKGIISIGTQSIERKDNHTRLVFSKNGMKADLRLRPWFAGFQVGDGKTIVDRGKGGFYRTFIEIPRCDMEGTLTVQGTERSIKGAGYMDHTVSNVLPPSYSRNWYSMRAFFPDCTVALLEFQYVPRLGGGKWTMGFVADKTGLLGASTDCRIETSGSHASKDCTVPTRFAVRMTSGDIKLDGTFSDEDVYCCVPVLGGSSWVVRKLAATLIGDMTVCRFRAAADLQLTLPDGVRHLDGPAYQGTVSMGN